MFWLIAYFFWSNFFALPSDLLPFDPGNHRWFVFDFSNSNAAYAAIGKILCLIMVVCCLYFSVSIIIKTYRLRLNYFKSVWAWIDIFSVTLTGFLSVEYLDTAKNAGKEWFGFI